ncbi:UNVERIFIED_CONTAM: putative fatty acid methyltransferase, partial [Sesamum angustifolium]
ARISKEHHILEIGCGWGGLAIEVVKRTGCRYTGITLSEKQLQYTESKVKEAGLQDQIELLLCDYRQLPKSCKYDRIISCEMIEHVGHEFIEEFFKCCESALAENGILVLQFISVADEKYDEFRFSLSFIKEYIFPGGCLHSLSRITSAMAAASRLSKIFALGFDSKFMRTWEFILTIVLLDLNVVLLETIRSYSFDLEMLQRLANRTTLRPVIISDVRSENGIVLQLYM